MLDIERGTIPLRKLAVPVVAVVATLVAAPTLSRAQSTYSYPWCGVYPRAIGGYACYYKSYGTCMKTMSGIGGSCSVRSIGALPLPRRAGASAPDITYNLAAPDL
jgi:hypothetical protein